MITIGIVTFLRQQKLRRLLDSIRSRYPDIPIVIADHGRHLPARPADLNYQEGGTDTWILPFDCGLSVARNWLLDNTEGDLLLLDDDFEFTYETRIHIMEGILDYDDEVGIVCGDAGITHPMVFTDGGTRRATIKRWAPNRTTYILCDMADNFMLMRREFIQCTIRWNPVLKLAEHAEFFERVHRTSWKVAYTPSVKVAHHHGGDTDEYHDYRKRQAEFGTLRTNLKCLR